MSRLLCAAFLVAVLATAGSALDAVPLLECQALTRLSPNSSHPVKLAHTVKRCLGLTLNTDVRSGLFELRDRLPLSVKNAVFLDEVCLQVKRWGEFLYNPIQGFLYEGITPQQRRVFTWIDGSWEHHNKGDWRLVDAGHNHFRLVAANNGEMLSVTDVVVDKRRRVVATALDPHFTESRALWTLNPHGDFVYIRNVEYGEDLYAVDGLNYDQQRRAVNTWSSDDGGCLNHEQCLWKIIPC